ncbi:trypsin-like cysteine/serine peptidase domain-containing protein [Aspergillus carlsbadensis]|nr:trypsin-like cysteine/serine peptidase domain-containing protein [Aspergillus carlsbadensis]
MTRSLRSATRVRPSPASQKYDQDARIPITADPAIHATPNQVQSFTSGIKLIPQATSSLPDLDAEGARILRKKQQRLRASAQSISSLASKYGSHISNALQTTYIFAQHEAGTAVCVDAAGWILTCAHCFGESEDEWRAQRRKWLLAHGGVAVEVECMFWDARRDLALGRIVCVEGAHVPDAFACVMLPPSRLKGEGVYMRAPIVCIGQPGADDLESERPRKTDYALVEISEGRLRGLIPRADPQDNSEIGTLRHDAWTYWGHSGAPLLCRETGTLLGLHSSWDDETAMRHGVPLAAIREFLMEYLRGFSTGEDSAVSGDEPGEQTEVIMID